jgi:glycosyltransferase involved in cell wall biosynthesis
MEHIMYIPNEMVKFYYAAADLVVLPYRRIYQSGVLLMAMSYRKPVLASNLDAMKELIRDNETGFLFENKNIKSLSQRLVEILNDQHNLDEVATKGYDLVKDKYGWQRVGVMTRDCYLSL